jgi:hypothetical protein
MRIKERQQPGCSQARAQYGAKTKFLSEEGKAGHAILQGLLYL